MFKRLCLSFCLLLIGVIIYAVFRQEVLFLSNVRLSILEKIKIEIDYSNCHWLIYFIVYCLPDALWYAALLNIQIELYDGERLNIVLFIFTIMLPFVYEILQKVGSIQGTFDWLDILTYFFTLIIIVICQKKHFYQL